MPKLGGGHDALGSGIIKNTDTGNSGSKIRSFYGAVPVSVFIKKYDKLPGANSTG
jgi:hypothetical protein